MIRTAISGTAYSAIAASSAPALGGAYRRLQDGYYLWLALSAPSLKEGFARPPEGCGRRGSERSISGGANLDSNPLPLLTFQAVV
jgi:hypothetical protein